MQIDPTLSDAGTRYLLLQMDEGSIGTFITNGFQFFAAEIYGVIMGVSAIRPPTHHYYLFVRSGYQRRGIGRLLWCHARD